MNINHLIHLFYARLIKNKNVSIISNNCWGGIVSQFINIQYNTILWIANRLVKYYHVKTN